MLIIQHSATNASYFSAVFHADSLDNAIKTSKINMILMLILVLVN